MSGLLLKEFMILKASWKTYGLLLAFYAVFSFLGSSSFFATMMVVILCMLPLSSFSADELARWDKFAAALPGGRRAVVKAKYQFLFLTLAGALVLAFLIDLLAHFFGRDESAAFFELIATTLVCAAVGLLVNCLLYPFLFKYGSQKARVYLAMGVAIAFAILTVGFTLFQFDSIYVNKIQPTAPAAAAAAVVLLAAAMIVSYRVSCRIYNKKEF